MIFTVCRLTIFSKLNRHFRKSLQPESQVNGQIKKRHALRRTRPNVAICPAPEGVNPLLKEKDYSAGIRKDSSVFPLSNSR